MLVKKNLTRKINFSINNLLSVLLRKNKLDHIVLEVDWRDRTNSENCTICDADIKNLYRLINRSDVCRIIEISIKKVVHPYWLK